MHNFDKAKILQDRHIFITIEWGGTEYFSHCSDMSIEGVVELLDILKETDAKTINNRLTSLIQKEDEKQD
jgi:hypothetical protein